jgi:hypothetical protein
MNSYRSSGHPQDSGMLFLRREKMMSGPQNRSSTLLAEKIFFESERHFY